jgi:hypothetical protein
MDGGIDPLELVGFPTRFPFEYTWHQFFFLSKFEFLGAPEAYVIKKKKFKSSFEF